jgi:hypothetical protein
MKKHSDKSLKANGGPESLSTRAKAYVRYVGFESIEGGRRLRFSVKLPDHESVEITSEISDAAFTAASGISIQDAAPMAYEKIVALLATEGALEPDELCLTDADIAVHNSAPQFTKVAIFNAQRKATIRRRGLMKVGLCPQKPKMTTIGRLTPLG